MKFSDLNEFDKLKVWLFYKIIFIKLKIYDKYEFNHLTFEDFKIHKYGGHNWGEQDRILDLFRKEIFG